MSVLDNPPGGDRLTDYDRAMASTYLRLLDADADGADWRDASRHVLGLDPSDDEARARRIHESHLARARWLANQGYRDFVWVKST
ncbi:DNA -binding domain-containing protein [Brevundimonas aurifodinae]|uniref:DUF2285 domain-containing protein n=1 Tax=Brevundimonas aurifodinae TaxID=1508312 RepID=A0ABV1NN93_9CAUL